MKTEKKKQYNKLSYYNSKSRKLLKELEDIDWVLYGGNDSDSELRYFMLERKRDDVIRALVLQFHTATEDLLDVGLRSTLLNIPATKLSNHKKKRTVSGHLLDELLEGGRSIGFENKLKLLRMLGILKKQQYLKLIELNSLRNKCSHNWLLSGYIRKGIKRHLPKRPFLHWRNKNLYEIKIAGEFGKEYGNLYHTLWYRIYR